MTAAAVVQRPATTAATVQVSGVVAATVQKTTTPISATERA